MYPGFVVATKPPLGLRVEGALRVIMKSPRRAYEHACVRTPGCLAMCSSTWGELMPRLEAYVETGMPGRRWAV